MNMKKLIKRTAWTVLGLGIAGGGIGGGIHYYRQNNTSAVEVYPVEALNSADYVHWDEDNGVEGQIRSEISQKVVVPSNMFVKETYVEPGQEVKIGDKLLAYDTTLLELDQELQELTVQKDKIELEALKKDLEKLKNTVPVESNEGDEDYYDYYGGAMDDYEMLEYDDAEVRMTSNDRTMLAAADEESEAASETDIAMEADTEAEEESGITETDQELILDDAPDQESGQTDEIILDDRNETEGSVDNFDLLPDGKPAQTDKEREEEVKKNSHLSLEGFLNNIRVKLVVEGGEQLLLDTKHEEEEELIIEEAAAMKLIPHFREDAEHQFQEKGTYELEIQGLHLEDDIQGNVYGIAAINGDDYPEIGGFTLTKKDEKSAILIIAFHDGLAKEHEVDPALEDMYVELPVFSDNILAGTLSFVVSEENENNRAIMVEENEDLFEEDGEIPLEEEPAMEEPQEESQDELTEELPEEPQEEPQDDQPVAQDPENPDIWDPGNETETEQDPDVPMENKEKANFQVTWHHGTNSSFRWPESLKIFFYAEKDGEVQWSLNLARNGIIRMDRAEGVAGDTEDAPALDAGVIQPGEETITAGEIRVETDPDDDLSSELWEVISLKWPKDSSFAIGEEADSWVYAENYTGKMHYDTRTNTYIIEMNYREPLDSPLVTYESLNELSYIHGVNTLDENGPRAYKGSGTPEDPFVFLVKENVKINSSFVNWAMGFNEDGTQRIGEGYVIKLEIRDGDTMGGVFLRAVELNGRVPMEQGFGPGTYWTFNSSSGLQKFEEEVTDPTEDDEPYDPYDPDDFWDDPGETYTKEQLERAIREKELEIRKQELDLKESELKLKQYNKEMEDSVVMCALNGVVSNIGGDGYSDDYMTIKSVNGLYVETTIEELKMDTIEVGDPVQCYSWEKGNFNATITRIDTVPVKENSYDYYGYGSNPNSSKYPVIAVIDEEAELEEGYWVQVKYKTKKKRYSDIYLEKAYVRSENGQSYVYVMGSDNKLHKQYVKTGETVWNSLEIKAGLQKDDYVAFPYSKNAKEGAAATISKDYEEY